MHCAMVSTMASHKPPPHSQSGLILSGEVARLLGINQVTVSRWVKSGKLKAAHRLPGNPGVYLFDRDVIEQLAAERAEDAEASA
jgi:excisionase family DNA binding protein